MGCEVRFCSDLACVYYCSMFDGDWYPVGTWFGFVGEIPKISLLMEFTLGTTCGLVQIRILSTQMLEAFRVLGKKATSVNINVTILQFSGRGTRR